MKVAVFLVVFAVAYARPLDPMSLKALSQDIIDYTNSLNTTWKAAKSLRFEGVSEDYLRGLCGVLPGGPTLPVKEITPLEDIPDEFDARTQWPDCPSISDIRDQGSCGSCWALGAVEAMSDRHCIQYNENVNLSAEDLLSCCLTCGNGCEGGYPLSAWEYWKDEGIVTGGQYNSKEGCQPYKIAKCNHHEPGPYDNCSAIQRTPNCEKKCVGGYSVEFDKDKHFGKTAYAVRRDVKEIQTEIMTNGPVEGAFTVFADFPTYKSGVYQHKSGSPLGGHAIRILGWGSEDGVPYWLIANSWNPSWGDKGYFKMIRGKDDCGIEAGITAGLAKQYK